MKLSTGRFYAYFFFHSDPYDREDKQKAGEEASSFCDRWMQAEQLTEYGEEDFPHLGDVAGIDLRVLRLSAREEGPSLCLFVFHDIAVAEVEWWQGKSETTPDFWKRTGDMLKAHLRNLPPFRFYMGCSCISFARSDDLSPKNARAIAQNCKWETNTRWTSVEISHGKLYDLGQHRHLLLSRDVPEQPSPDEFLGRDFALMESFLHKLEFEEKQMKKIKEQNNAMENQLQKWLSQGLREIETYFPKIREHQKDIHYNVTLLARLQKTLYVNVLNFKNHAELLSPRKDLIFRPALDKFRRVHRQLGFDLSYARLAMEGIESQLQFLELQISNERLKTEKRQEEGQRRIEKWIAVFGVALAIGGATTNMPESKWEIRLLMMGVGALVTLFVLWVLGLGKEK